MKPLSLSFNRAVLHIANSLMPEGWIGVTNAPDTLATLRGRVCQEGRMIVSSEYALTSVYADPAVNLAFRAWHDYCHLSLSAEFDRAGETAVHRMQSTQLILTYGAYRSRNWRMILRCEILGQLDYREAYGAFPVDQMAFAKEYLTWH